MRKFDNKSCLNHSIKRYSNTKTTRHVTIWLVLRLKADLINELTWYYLVIQRGTSVLEQILISKSQTVRTRRTFDTGLVQNLLNCILVMVAHRDLKSKNLFVVNHYPFHIKISDFGMSKVVERDGFLKTFYGSPLYAVSEACPNGKKSYQPLVDIWSVRVIIMRGYLAFHLITTMINVCQRYVSRIGLMCFLEGSMI